MSTFSAAGSFNRRIILQSPETIQDQSGDPVVSWVELAEVWAACESDRGREFYASSGIVASKPMLFRMWYRDDVTPQTRILYRGDIYNADSVEDYRDGRTETRIYAQAGVNLG